MEIAMLGMKLYFDALMKQGPEVLNSGLMNVEKRLSNRRAETSLGIMGRAMAENLEPRMPRGPERL